MSEGTHDQHVCRTEASAYGEKYADHLLEQYKLFVHMADEISARRATANNYFLAVNSLLVPLSGAISALAAKLAAWQVVIPIAGIILCATWFVLIRSYRTMNTAKFKVIHELEQRLPAALYDREWELAEHGRTLAHIPFAKVEQFVPVVFVVLYLVLVIVMLVAGDGTMSGG